MLSDHLLLPVEDPHTFSFRPVRANRREVDKLPVLEGPVAPTERGYTCRCGATS